MFDVFPLLPAGPETGAPFPSLNRGEFGLLFHRAVISTPARVQRIFSFLLLLFLPLAALADGLVVPTVAYPAKITIPDQRALICYTNGTERLAIETRFVGEGTNFAWVVPLPGKPVIEEATSGLFTTLDYIFRPTVIHNVIPLYAILLVCLGVAYLLLHVRRNTPPRISDTLISVLVALAVLPLSAFVAILLLGLLPYVVWRVRTNREGLWAILGALFLAFFFGGMMLSTLGTAGMGVSGTQVSILSRETVGVYDTTTLAAKDPRALVEWLNDNGYVAPPAAGEVISNYVKRGWVFVATKLHRDSAGRTIGSPHPLCFTFQTDKAIYPMQLTGVGNTNLTVELFVFGPSRAEASYFKVERCGAPFFQEPQEFSRGSTAQIRIVHPLLRKWVAGSSIATKLSADLKPGMMKEDIELRWLPFAEVRHNIYSYQGALIFSANCGVSVFASCLLLASIVTAFKPDWQPRLKKVAGLVAVAGVVVAALAFVAVPKTVVRLTNHPYLRSQLNLRGLAYLYEDDSQTNHASSLAESRAILKTIKVSEPKLTAENLLLGGPIREEDSPGNYVLRESTNGVEFVWFDADGGEHNLERKHNINPRSP